MADLPAAIRDFIEDLTDDLLAPAYLRVTDDDGLYEWGGALESYGLIGMEKNIKVDEHFVFLGGLLPLDAGGVFLPHVQTKAGVFADLYLFRRGEDTWILFLDATANVKKRQALQQRTYDISLRAAQLEREGQSLNDTNTTLERRVAEQTRELSQTVVRLQQELVDGRRAEQALSVSESRFRSLYDSNIIGIVFWDVSGNITGANEAFLRLIGYSKDDLASGLMKWDRLTVADQGAPWAPRESMATEPQERDFICKDGSHTTLLFGADLRDPKAEKSVGFALSLPQRRNTQAG
jgi:PAS domain S-box-containing protein